MNQKNKKQDSADNTGTKVSIAIIIAAVLIAGAIFLSKVGPASSNETAGGNNVSIVDGKQIVEITARGGYTPRRSVAKAGIPTILRVKTNGTFDCSAAIRIPRLNIGTILPQTGTTDLDIGTLAAGTLHGSCGMGMYPFDIDFTN